MHSAISNQERTCIWSGEGQGKEQGQQGSKDWKDQTERGMGNGDGGSGRVGWRDNRIALRDGVLCRTDQYKRVERKKIIIINK